MPEPDVTYESRLPGTLQPGETVLAEFMPVATSARERRKLGDRRYRVTDRRVMCVDSRPHLCWTVDVFNLRDIGTSLRKGRTEVYINSEEANIRLQNVTEIGRAFSALLSLPARIGRRRRIRRSREAPLPPVTIGGVTAHPDWMLQDGEVLLWTGRPSTEFAPARFFLTLGRRLFWLLVPAAMIFVAVRYVGLEKTGAWILAIIGAMWALGALHGLTIQPMQESRRRAFMHYALTNLRLISDFRDPWKRQIHSTFLDMADHVSVQLNDDGTGDVMVGSQIVGRVQDAATLHSRLLDAIRTSGGPLLKVDASPIEED